MRGVVEYFDDRRGFGRISPADGSAAVFCHFSCISDPIEQVLIQGEEVEFSVEITDRGPTARHVARVEPRFKGKVRSFDKGHGRIAPNEGSQEIFVHYSDIARSGYKRLEVEEEVTFSISTGDRGRKAVRVRRLDTRPPLERFATLPAFDAKLDLLAGLAQQENWAYRHTPTNHRHPVLRSYIFYTFARVETEGKIAFAVGENGRQLACFNTGLATPRQEAIFGLFAATAGSATSAQKPQWCLDSFAKESDRTLSHFGQRPDLANYFTEPSELLYDTRVELVVDIDHVISDNHDRFPPEMQGNEFARA